MVDGQTDELTLLKAERDRRRGIVPETQPDPVMQPDDELAALYAERDRRKEISATSEPNEYSYGERAGQFARGAAKFYGGTADLVFEGAQALSKPVEHALRDKLSKISAFPLKEESNAKPEVTKVLTESVNKLAGRDLTPTDATGRILENSGEFAAGSAIPGGGVAGLVKSVASGAGIGAGSGILQEGGIPKTAADITTLIAAIASPKIIKGLGDIFKGSKSLTDAEERVGKYLQDALGEAGTAEVVKNIETAPQFGVTGYEPATAEVANVPLFSQLDRLRRRTAGTGLSEHAGVQNKAISQASERLSSNAITSPELREAIGSELTTRRNIRRSETAPLYANLGEDTTQIDPLNVKEYFSKSIAKGKKRKDLESFKKLIEPTNPLSKEEKLALENYTKQEKFIRESKMSDAAKERELSKLEKPRSGNPTVAELDEAHQNINDFLTDLEEAGKSGTNRYKQAKDIKDALIKDLEAAPLQREVTAKYAELSKPVNEILKHKTLSKLPKNTSNEILGNLYDKNSLDNVSQLKKVLKDRPEDWKGFQDASLEYLMDSIKNSGAEGSGNVLSYTKLNRFLRKHDKALQEVLDSNQLTFLEELKNATKGRNIADTLGLERGSPTYGRFITGAGLEEGFGSKILNKASHAASGVPKIGRPIGGLLRSWLEKSSTSNKEKAFKVLDQVLKEPEYTKKLLTHKFKTQTEFDGYLNSIKKSIPVAERAIDKED